MSQPSPTAILRNGLRVLFPLSVVLTFYLYLFPVFSSCAFPLPPTNNASAADTGRAAFLETAKLHWQGVASAKNESEAPTVNRPIAPFRLLALGDPQLEGDTSLPITYLGIFPHVKSIARHVTFQSEHESLRHRVRQILHDLIDIVFEDTYHLLESARKRIDLLGNDFYLAHIYRTVHWWTRPTHVSVLGDLLGSQWLDDGEFYRRADRFWSRVFRGAERVPDDLAMYPDDEYDLSGYLSADPRNTSVWTQRLINVAGNHDIGYAGDINEDRAARFEKAFGKLNYELRFELPLSNESLAPTVFDPLTNPSSTNLVPELRIVVLNDMNLDTPAAVPALQDETYNFINNVINTASAVEFKGHFTLVLTHIPLYKPAGVCIDAPLFDFHEHDGTLREQNQLSAAASKGFVEGILGISGDSNAAGGGRGRKGVIMNGHDHEGCDTYHYINQSRTFAEGREWEGERWRQAKKKGLLGQEELPGAREITVRSMMGDFGGNAGLLSIWFDEGSWEWKMEYAICPLGRQHLWWLVHILDLVVVVGAVLSVVAWGLGAAGLDVDRAVMCAVRGLGELVCGRKKAESVGVNLKGEERKPLKVDSPS